MKLLLTVTVIILVYVLQKSLFRRYWDKGLEARIDFDKEYIECGESAHLYEHISNEKLLPLPIFHMKFSIDRSFVFDASDNSNVSDLFNRTDTFSIMGNQRIERTLGFIAKKRGFYGIERESILVKDFFLIDTYARNIPPSAKIYVFPEKKRSKSFDDIVRGIQGELEKNRGLITDVLMLRGIRDYGNRDSFRYINWKKSAREDKLKVNEYAYTSDMSVRIILNLDVDNMLETNRIYEESISVASSLKDAFLKEGMRVSFMSNATLQSGEALSDIAPGGEMSHSVTIDKALSLISGTLQKDNTLKKIDNEMKRGTEAVYYVIISPYYKEDLLQRIDRMRKKGIGVSFVVPYFDKIGLEKRRDYIIGWEVPVNDISS